MVLLVVDTQKALVNHELFGFEEFVQNIQGLITTARDHNIEVIYVVHDDGIGSDLTKGTEGFEIYEKFCPMADEKIFIKTVNSAFKESGLLEYLRSKEETDIIIAGLQTDKCIDATVTCGFEHEFHVIVPAYANSTVNNHFMSAEKSYHYHNEYLWNGRYAECISVNETIERMNR